MVLPKRMEKNRSSSGLFLAILPIAILLLAALQSTVATEPTIVDNGDYTFTSTWDFNDLTNYTLTNLTTQNGEVNLTINDHFWNQSSAMDFAEGQRSNVVQGDGVVESTDDLILGYIQNQNFSDPFGWEYNNGTESMVLAEWSPLEYANLYSSHVKNTNSISIDLNLTSTIFYDTYLDENNPFLNRDGENRLRVQREIGNKRRSILWFDVSLLSDAKILDAQLRLYHFNGIGGTNLQISAHTMTSPWDEGTANWDTFDGAFDWPINNDGGDYNIIPWDVVNVQGASSAWNQWNITGLVDGWASGSIANFGVLLNEFGGDNTWKEFYSSNYGISSSWPQLRVQYYELNSFNETSNITQDFPVMDPGAYRDSDVADFEQGQLDNISIIPSGGGEIILNSEAYYKFDTMDDVSSWVEDASTSDHKGVKKSSTTYKIEGIGSMWLDYDLANDQMVYGVMRTASGTWDWSGYTDLVLWAKSVSVGIGEVMKLILLDSSGQSWEESKVLLDPWTSYQYDLTAFTGDISRIKTIKLHFTNTNEQVSTYIDNITLLGGAPYYYNGNFTSRVIDGGYEAIWDIITWKQSTPGASSIQISTRTGNTQIPDISWSPWSAPYGTPSGSPVTSPQGRYIQYMAYLNTPDDSYSPVVSEVVLVKSEYNMTFTYSVDSYINVPWAHLFLRLNDVVLWEEYLSETVPLTTISFDIGRYLYNTGDIPIEFGLQVEGHTEDGMNVSVIIDDFQIKGPFGYYLSQAYDVGSEAMWKNVTWNAQIPSNTDLILRTRTSMDNVTWSSWSLPHTYPMDTITNPMGRYIQYNVNLSTNILGLTPVFKTINISYSKYAAQGALTFTQDLVVENVTNWGYLETNCSLSCENIYYEYSIDSGSSWNPISSDLNLSSVSTFSNKIRFNVILSTLNTSNTPTLYSIKLIYSINHPPVIVGVVPNQIRDEDSGPWSIDLSAFESDFEETGNKLRWSIEGENISLYVVDGEYSTDDIITFYPQPHAYGNDLVTLWLEDSFGARASQPLWINITPVNDPPQIMGVIPSFDKTENDPNWQLDLSGYKFDRDNTDSELSWSIIGVSPLLFDSVSISQDIMTFDLAPDAYGNNEIEIRLSDPEYVVSQKIWVNVSFINRAPTISGIIPDISIIEDGPGYVLDLTGNETDREDPYPSPGLSWSVWGVNISLVSYSIADNNITFIPIPDAYGSNEITLTLTDSLGLTTSQKLWVNVSAQNDAPKIMGVIPNFEKLEDAPDWNYDLSIYKSDIDNSTSDLFFVVSNVNNSLFDSIIVIGDIIYFDLAQDAFGNDEITLILSDGMLTDSQNLWVNITSDNDEPIIEGIIPDFNINEDALPWILDLTTFENDTEDKGPSSKLTWSVSGVDSNLLSVTISDNNLTFTLNQDAYGNNEITITLSDSGGLLDSQKFWVNVSADNDAPVILGNIPSFEKLEDAPNWILNLSAYKFDIDNIDSELFWEIISWDPSLFDLSINGDDIIFNLVSEAFGTYEMTINLTDGEFIDSQNIWVNVTSINDAPFITGSIPDYNKFEDDLSWTVDLTELEDDIEDNGPSPSLIWSIEDINSDILSISVSDNNITFTLKSNASGNNRLKAVLTDFEGLSDTIYFWVNVSAENDEPKILGDIPDFGKNEDDSNWIFDLSGIKSDVDNDTWELTWEISGWDGSLFDSVSILGDIITFDLKAHASGSSELTLNLSDGLLKDTQKFWVFVSPINDAPNIKSPISSYLWDEDSLPWVLDLTTYEEDVEDIPPTQGLTWTVSDVDWSLMSVSIVDNNLTFTLVPDAYGSNEITITLTDSQGKTDSQKIWVNVTALNDAPVILGTIPSFTYDEDASDWNVNLAPYKWDVDNNLWELSWSVAGWNPAIFDSVSITGDLLSFDLKSDVSGNNLITITLWDGVFDDTQEIWVNITPINDAPSIVGSIPDISLLEDGSSYVLDLTPNESDVEDGTPSSSLTWSVSGVDTSILSLTISDNNLTFTPIAEKYGSFYITVTLTDSGGKTDSQVVLIEIISVNDIPIIVPEISNIVINEDSSYSLNLSQHTYDVEDSIIQMRWAINGANSSLFSWNIDPITMMLNIEPLSNAYGTCYVDFVVIDSQGAYSTQKNVQILVISVNDEPYILPEIPESLFETLEDVAISVILTGYENDVEDTNDLLIWDVENVDTSIIRYSLDTTTDILVIVPVVEFSPDDTASIETQITLKLRDSQGVEVKQNITVKIIPVNNAPILDDLPDLIIKFDKPYEFDIMPYAYDEDTQLSQLILTTSMPTADMGEGYIQVNGLKLTLYFPEKRYGQNPTILVTLSDGLLSDYAIMQVTISDHTPPELVTPIDDVAFSEDTWNFAAFDLDDHFVGYNDGSLNFSYYMDYTHHGDENIFVTIQSNNTVDFFSAMNWHGSELITFRAEDSWGAIAETTILVTVIPVNDAPTILALPDQEVKVNAEKIMDLEPYIMDIDTPTEFLMISTSAIENIKILGHKLIFDYKNVTHEFVDIYVFDGELNNHVTIEVIASENQIPSISSIPKLTVKGGDVYLFSLLPYVNDPDNDLTDLVITTDSGYITPNIEDNLLLQIDYPANLVGTQEEVTIFISDGQDSNSTSFFIQITDEMVPKLKDDIPNKQFDEDTVLTNALNLYDYFTNATEFQIFNNVNVSYSISDGWVTLSASENWSGIEMLTIRGYLGEAFMEDTIEVFVRPVDDPPVLAPLPSFEKKLGELWILDLDEYISDIDTSKPDITIKIDSKYVILLERQIWFRYSFPIYDIVNVTVFQGLNTVRGVIHVNITRDNKAPSYTGLISTSHIQPGETWSIDLSLYFNDLDNDPLVFSCNKPEININPITHEASWTPRVNDTTLEDVIFYANDGMITIESSPIDLVVDKENTTSSFLDLFWWILLLLAILVAIIIVFVFLRREEDEEVDEYDLPVAKAVDYLTVNGGGNYIIKSSTSDKAYRVFSGMLKNGFEGLCITTKGPDELTNNYDLGKAWIIKLALRGQKNIEGEDEETQMMGLLALGDEEREDDKYIFSLNFNRIVETIEEFLTTGHKKVVLLDGLEYILGGEELIMYIGFIAALRERLKDRNSCLLIPVDPRTLSEKELGLLERECEELGKVIQSAPKAPVSSPMDIMDKKEVDVAETAESVSSTSSDSVDEK
jgi:hypothetical protein